MSIEMVYLERDIRRGPPHLRDGPTKLLDLLTRNHPESDSLFVSLDLSCLKSLYFPGVSIPSPAMGFSLNEMKDMLRLVGSRANCVSISEYNPAIEKLNSGKALLSLLSALLDSFN